MTSNDYLMLYPTLALCPPSTVSVKKRCADNKPASANTIAPSTNTSPRRTQTDTVLFCAVGTSFMTGAMAMG